MYRYMTHLFELIYDKKGFVSLNSISQEKGVNIDTLIINLQDLINQIKVNPPIFKKEVSEEDEIKFLQILNKLKKNNVYKGNYFEIEIREDIVFIHPYVLSKDQNNLNWWDFIDDLDDLVHGIKANPPQFKKEVSEEDEIKFLQILNKLKKNNIDNLSEDELDELALLQLERSKKNQPKEKEAVQKEEVIIKDEPKQEQKKGRDLGELVNILNVEKTVKPNHETFKSYKTKEGSYGITFKGQTLFIDDLSEEMINEIVSKDSPIPFGKIRQVPYMLTKEALDNEDVRAKIDGDVVQVTYKREEKTQYDSLKGMGGTPK